jgi:pimeloyl-ACP methyl ester carboxylesterase
LDLFKKKEIFSQDYIINKINIPTQDGSENYQFDSVILNGEKDVLLIIVGINGSVKGYNNKYFRIAEKTNRIYNNTVFIISNDLCNWHTPKNYFNAIMNYVKENIPNNGETNIKLFGYSAGASLASYYAWEYPEIKEMLLVNPPLMKENIELTISGIKLFNGIKTFVIGKKDPSYEFSKILTLDNKYEGIFSDIIFLDNVNHNFKGSINEFIDLPFQYLYHRISLLI